MLFITEFGYKPHNGEFPKLNIRDLDSGIYYELSDLAEIKNGSVLKLHTSSKY